MALSRRSGHRVTSSIWTGFVDAMTGLLLVFMFVLSMFMIVQFVLSGTITTQEDQLFERNQEIAQLQEAIKIKDDELSSLALRISGLLGDIESKNIEITNLESKNTDQLAENSLQSDLINELNFNLEGLNKSIEEQQNVEIQLRSDLDDSISEIEKRNQQILLYEAQLAQFRKDLEALNEELNTTRDNLDAQVAEKIKTENQQNAEIQSLSELLDAIQLEKEQQAAIIATLNLQAEEFQNVIEKLRSQLETQLADSTALRNQYKQSQSNLDTANSQIDTLKTEIGIANEIDSKNQLEIESLESLVARLQDSISTLNQELATIQDAKALLEIQFSDAQTENSKLISENASLEETLAALDLRNQEIRRTLSEFEEQVTLLNQVVENLRGQIEDKDDELRIAQSLQSLSNNEIAKLKENQRAELLRLGSLEQEKAALELRLNESENLVRQLQNSTETLTAESKRQEENSRSLEDEVNRLAKLLEETTEKLSAETARLTSEEELRLQALRDIEQLQIALGAEAEESDDLRLRITQVQDETDALSQELNLLQSDLIDSQDEYSKLQILFDNQQNDKLNLSIQLNEELKTNDQLRSTINRHLVKIAQLETQLDSTKEVDNTTTRIKVLEAEKSMLQIELDSTKLQVKQLLGNISNEIDQRELTATRLGISEFRRQELKEENDAKQRQLIALNNQLAQLRRDLATLQVTLDESKEREEEASVKIVSLGAQLNEALAQKAAELQRLRQLEQAERERVKEDNLNLEKFRSEFFGQLREILEGREGIEVAGDRFVLASEVLFDSGEAVLSDTGKREIGNVAILILDLAAQFPESVDWVLRIDGHTDNRKVLPNGDFDDNWDLSQARSLAVVRYLTDEYGFPTRRLAATGFGEFRPLASNSTKEGRSRNRRIEFKLTEP